MSEYEAARNDLKFKITQSRYSEFLLEYYKGKLYQNQRFGQAFMNKFKIRPDAELFYATDKNLAERLIWEHYIVEDEKEDLIEALSGSE